MDNTTEEAKIAQKLLQKIAVWRFMHNIRVALERRQITRSDADISQLAGYPENAFNKAMNQAQDLQLSSLFRFWVAISELLEQEHQTPLQYEELLDGQVTRVVKVAIELSSERLMFVVSQHKSLFLDLQYPVRILSQRGRLLEEERRVFDEIIANVLQR